MIAPLKLNPVRCAAILAGGKSSRMGSEKALLVLEGKPLIAHVAAILKPIFPEICVVTSRDEVARAASCVAIEDHFAERGPVGGIHAALLHFGQPAFCVACDMPFLCGDFIRYLAENFQGDSLVPWSENGMEPLHAAYSPNCIAVFEKYLVGDYKMPSIRRILGEVDTHFVNVETVRRYDASLRCFSNWNTPEDVASAQ